VVHRQQVGRHDGGDVGDGEVVPGPVPHDVDPAVVAEDDADEPEPADVLVLDGFVEVAEGGSLLLYLK